MEEKISLKDIQDAELEILKYVHNFCVKNNLRYSLAYGTLLGAVRHKGFIPWDDDIDICMPREDYDRFLELWEDNDDYILMNKRTNHDFSQNFTKIKKNHTTFLQEEDRLKSYHKGIFLDIFPGERAAGGKTANKIQYIYCALDLLFSREFRSGTGGLIGITEKILLGITTHSLRIKLLPKIQKKISKYNGNHKLNWFFPSTIEGCGKKRYKKSDLFDNLLTVKFVDSEFYACSDYDSYLTSSYGDYMQLPPEQDRVWTHSPICINLEHNYEEIVSQEPLHVLQVIGSMNIGGAESMIMNYYRHIDRSKVQFDFVENTEKRAVYDDEIEELGGKIYYCPHFKGYNYFSYRKWWQNFFKAHKEYRIMHGHIGSCAAIYLAQAKKNGLTAIAHSHSECFENCLKGIQYRLFSYPTRYIADYFFGCSQNALVSRYGQKISESDNSYVIFNAVDIQKFQFNETNRAQIRDKYNLIGKTVIGHVARFFPVKNHTFLIDVFSVLHKMHPDTVLMLFGTGETEDMIKSKVRELGIESSVIFMGAVADVNMYLSALDLFILPSVYEGLPVSVIEAQANSLPCLLSDAISKDCAITDSVFFLPLDADKKEWAEKMYKLAKMPRRDNADAVAQAGYDIKTKAEWLKQFYLDLCD